MNTIITAEVVSWEDDVEEFVIIRVEFNCQDLGQRVGSTRRIHTILYLIAILIVMQHPFGLPGDVVSGGVLTLI